MSQVEGPYDVDGNYTWPCGTDRRGRAYNRRSIFHAHAAPCDPFGLRSVSQLPTTHNDSQRRTQPEE